MSIVFKAKTKEKYEEIFLKKVFVSNLINVLFWGANYFFSFCFSFKNNRGTNVVLVNIFENALKKVNRQKLPKWRF